MLGYIKNLDQTEECVLVGSNKCLANIAFGQLEEQRIYFTRYVIVGRDTDNEKVEDEMWNREVENDSTA